MDAKRPPAPSAFRGPAAGQIRPGVPPRTAQVTFEASSFKLKGMLDHATLRTMQSGAVGCHAFGRFARKHAGLQYPACFRSTESMAPGFSGQGENFTMANLNRMSH